MTKPLIYIDQTVVSLQANGRIDLAKARDLQCVYSKEHFAEIRRSADPRKFLAALDSIGAELIELELSDWRLSGQASVVRGVTASDHYARYVEANDQVDFDVSVVDPLMAWINGGGSRELLLKVPDALDAQYLKLTSDLPEYLIPGNSKETFQAFRNSIEQLASRDNDIDQVRCALGVGKGAAGSVSGADELLQIWEMISPNIPGITSDQFFGFEPPTRQDHEGWPMYLGIIGCCAVLDVLGFQAEQKARRPEWIRNVRSDAAHIAAGAYCVAIVSADQRFSRRAKAIYRYKGIGTVSLIMNYTG